MYHEIFGVNMQENNKLNSMLMAYNVEVSNNVARGYWIYKVKIGS
jgi:hypothetical protein